MQQKADSKEQQISSDDTQTTLRGFFEALHLLMMILIMDD